MEQIPVLNFILQTFPSSCLELQKLFLYRPDLNKNITVPWLHMGNIHPNLRYCHLVTGISLHTTCNGYSIMPCVQEEGVPCEMYASNIVGECLQNIILHAFHSQQCQRPNTSSRCDICYREVQYYNMVIYPLGEKSIPYRDLRWPSMNMMHRPVRRSHTRPKASSPLQKKCGILHMQTLNHEWFSWHCFVVTRWKHCKQTFEGYYLLLLEEYFVLGHNTM